MNRFLLFLAMILSLSSHVISQVLVQRDNGNPKGMYSNMPSFTEESVLLKPDGPCKILEIRVYYGGGVASTDTLWIVGDPSEGYVPPTSWVWSYNTLINPIIVTYNGSPGWRTIDVRNAGLRSDGYDRIVIQHRIKPSGPWFVIDDATPQAPYTSFLMDPTKTNSLGGPGVFSLTQGNFMVRLLVEYDFPSGATSQNPPPATLVDVTKSVGLTNASGDYLKSVQISAVDWNNDGWDDVAIGGNFFRNKGDGTYENVTSSIGVTGGATIWGDFNNDGFIDVYTVSGGDNDKLFKNNGDGTFTDVTAASKLSNPYPTVTPIWLDYNNDGFLDLFIANGRKTIDQKEVYFPDQLWRNEGDGTFTNVTQESGIAAGEPDPYYDCWGASACDYNNDGLTDIFVSTYRLAPDLLYRNNGNGTFTEVGSQTGVRGVPTSYPQYFGHGMGSDWGDFDNDGDADLVVGNLGHPDWRGAVSNPSLVFQNNGAPSYDFTSVGRTMGLKFFEMNAGVAWADLDHDGYLDLWSCQYAYNAAGQQGEPTRLSRVYINDGPPNYKLKDMTWHLGSLIHGAWTVVRIDYDNDGDLDLLAASPTEAVILFRNDIAKKGRWLSLRLVGSPDNDVPMDAYGTSVTVFADGKKFMRTLSTGSAGSRAAQHSNELHFGLGNVMKIDSVVVRYQNGVSDKYTTLNADMKYKLTYGGGVSTDVESVSPQAGTWDIADARYYNGSILYTLRSDDIVREMRAEVYNALGVKVATAQMGDLAPGIHAFRPESTLSSGVYFLRFASTNSVKTAKISVLR